MKNILRFCTVVAFLLLSTTLVFAQEIAESIPIVDTEFTQYFVSFTALVGIIPVVTEMLKNLFKVTKETPNLLIQILSWGTGILLTMFGWFFNLPGFLEELEWYYALLYGLGASLAANGVADTKLIQWIFSLFIKK